MEIVMGTRGTLEKPVSIKQEIGDLKINKTSIGMEEKIKPKENKPTETKKVELPIIEIDNIKASRLIDIVIEDLKKPRLMKVNGLDTEVHFIKEYNPRSKIIKFNYSIQEINKILKVNEEDLSNFFLSFLFNNIRKYIKNEWNAQPESLPIISVDEAGIEIPNTIIVAIR